jgi:YHS domain-containing protein
MHGNRLQHLAQSLVLFMMTTTFAYAGAWNTNADNVVLDGYDVVAYRSADRAIKGSASNSASYDGVKFYFSSKENLAAFNQNPALYAPRYNGFCAFAVGAKNAKVPANPDTFKLYNGELLVFFNDMYDGQKFNTKIPWNENEQALYSKAETNWKELKKAK